MNELGRQGAFSNDGSVEAFFDLIQEMSTRNIRDNVLYESSDEELTPQRLAPYRTVIVPDAFLMDQKTADVLNNYRTDGGEVIACSRKPESLNASAQYGPDETGLLFRHL